MNPKGKIDFKLFAPRNNNVELLGSWSDQPLPMERGMDGYWRATVNLKDGDYTYGFAVLSNSTGMKEVRVEVADPVALQYEPKNYRRSVLRVRDGQPLFIPYEWQHDDNPLPPNEQLIIYEMHIGDFRGGEGDTDDQPGTFNRVVEKLDDLVDLGITAIELMPVTQSPPHNWWGYSQHSLYAVDYTYGTPEELCRLIDECHARGIRVIHDGVYNHMEELCPMAQIDYDYWFYESNPDKSELHFGPKFNFDYFDPNVEASPARSYVAPAIKRWVADFHFDGIRFDSTKTIDDPDLLGSLCKIAHDCAGVKPFITIAEHLPQDPSITGSQGALDAMWHESYYYQIHSTILGVEEHDMKPFDTSRILKVLDTRADGFESSYNTIKHNGNHDHERLFYEIGAVAGVFDDPAFVRAKLAATLLLTAPGMPMIWMGCEWGDPTPKSQQRNPLKWSLRKNKRNNDLREHYKTLIALRKRCAPLTGDQFETVADMPDRGVIAYKRMHENGAGREAVIVVANLKFEDAGLIQIQSDALDNGTYDDALSGETVNVSKHTLKLQLDASEAKVLIKRNP